MVPRRPGVRLNLYLRRWSDRHGPYAYSSLSPPEGLFRMTQELHWNTPLISRDRTDVMRFFDGFTLVDPGLVPPAQWRPDLDNPLRDPQATEGDGGPVLQPVASHPPADELGMGWHWCGVGVKDQP
jgi:hypothetical protein